MKFGWKYKTGALALSLASPALSNPRSTWPQLPLKINAMALAATCKTTLPCLKAPKTNPAQSLLKTTSPTQRPRGAIYATPIRHAKRSSASVRQPRPPPTTPQRRHRLSESSTISGPARPALLTSSIRRSEGPLAQDRHKRPKNLGQSGNSPVRAPRR
jgi:hypothetical protein